MRSPLVECDLRLMVERSQKLRSRKEKSRWKQRLFLLDDNAHFDLLRRGFLGISEMS